MKNTDIFHYTLNANSLQQCGDGLRGQLSLPIFVGLSGSTSATNEGPAATAELPATPHSSLQSIEESSCNGGFIVILNCQKRTVANSCLLVLAQNAVQEALDDYEGMGLTD